MKGSLYEDINWSDRGVSSNCIYLYLSKNQKRKNITPDAVQSFHQKYDRIRNKPKPDTKIRNHTKQITRYNSAVDYITREDLAEDKNRN